MAIAPHPIRFIKKELYGIVRSPAVQKEPFYQLTSDEWLQVLHHLDAHEIQGLSRRGAMTEILSEHTPRFFLYDAAKTYLAENNGPSAMALVPEREKGLYTKVARLWAELNDYELVDISTEPDNVIWDIQKKAA